MKDSLPDSATRQRPGSGRERPESASRARTDSIMSIEVCMSNAVFNRYHHKGVYLTKFCKSLSALKYAIVFRARRNCITR